MNLVEDLFAFIGPRPVAVQEMGRSRVLLLSAFAVLSALVLAAFWGVAAGSSLRHLALGNDGDELVRAPRDDPRP